MEKRTPSPDGSEMLVGADVNLKQIFNPDVDTSGVDERKLIRKIDMALIPWLSFLYLLSFLDRTSIGKWARVLLICRWSVSLHFSTVPRWISKQLDVSAMSDGQLYFIVVQLRDGFTYDGPPISLNPYGMFYFFFWHSLGVLIHNYSRFSFSVMPYSKFLLMSS